MDAQDIKDFKAAHKRVYYECGFKWVSDQERLGKIESWNSLWDDQEKGIKLEGDCEDAALTVMDICVDKGIDPDRIGIARIKTKNSQAKYFDHAVAVLLNSKDEVELVSDCNYPDSVLRSIKGKPYDFISANDLAMGNQPRMFSD
tara:strand:+ start:961 stop:1395 length:435 start_codon:yes stop_codon:yes gene_type:complete